ncbi:DEAD/DEAH box helicase [Paenibacillus sp. E194]|uniref:DEAD/DEAH box helicase n=1 Tax=Paenibacillus sp. E194 TaxID=1458845 RepID=UPI001E4A671F|nr:DEAD/DEAH box helicase [Paenibacillus sp. E194]
MSAPTSAGKSYILLRLIEEQFFSLEKTIGVYIVPTRALIQQVEIDIVEAFNNAGLNNVAISSIPSLIKDWDCKPQLYVLTQERLLWILNEEPNFIPNIVVIDEAQKVGDGSRGILLQQAIEELTHRSKNTKFLFSSPLTENPEIFLNDAPNDISTKPVASEYVAVNQNLIWVNQIPKKPLEWEMNLCINEDTYILGKFNISSRPSHISMRLPLVAYALADFYGGNLLYANGAAEAEKMALQLWSLQGSENETSDTDLLNLIELSSKTINKKYSLCTVLSRGVGFHYGNMPLLIKNEIEKLFKSGKIKFLVCTSTLIEGVNLPAKSIFIRGPKKGRGKPMGEMDFWNLAGRAGRQGKEFQGNVVCVDPTSKKAWTEPPPRKRKKYTISKAVDYIVENNSKDLLDYIELSETKVKVDLKPEFDYVFTYFLGEYLKNESFKHLEGKYSSDFLVNLTGIADDVRSKIEIPLKIINNNPGINPYAMQRLLEYFRNYSGEIQELIPSLPEDENALTNYCDIIGIISEYLSGDVPQLTYPHALLVLNWLRGMSLSRIIDRNWGYWSKKVKNWIL